MDYGTIFDAPTMNAWEGQMATFGRLSMNNPSLVAVKERLGTDFRDMIWRSQTNGIGCVWKSLRKSQQVKESFCSINIISNTISLKQEHIGWIVRGDPWTTSTIHAFPNPYLLLAISVYLSPNNSTMKMMKCFDRCTNNIFACVSNNWKTIPMSFISLAPNILDLYTSRVFGWKQSLNGKQKRDYIRS